MQNDFEPRNIKQAKNILLKDLEVAEHIHTMQKEQQKAAIKKTSLWNRIKSFFRSRI